MRLTITLKTVFQTFTILEILIRCKIRIFVQVSCWNCTFGPWLITDFSCLSVCSSSEYRISPFHMTSSYGLVQGSKWESVYSPVMSAHDITWVHSSAGSLGRYLEEITQAIRGWLAGSPFIRLHVVQDKLFHRILSLGAFFSVAK